MSNYRQDPFINLDSIQKFQQELGRLFEGDWVKPSSRYNDSGDWMPATDTVETESQWQFLVELAGVSLSDIDVSVHRGEIVVKGTKQPTQVGNVVSREASHGKFSRVIQLPEDSDESTLNASMKNGILTLTVAKTALSAARPIPVREVD